MYFLSMNHQPYAGYKKMIIAAINAAIKCKPTTRHLFSQHSPTQINHQYDTNPNISKHNQTH